MGDQTSNLMSKQPRLNNNNQVNKTETPILINNQINTDSKIAYYICGIDPNMNNLIVNFIQNIAPVYSIYSRIPPKTITEIKGNHFSNIKEPNYQEKIVIFLYSDPINVLSSSNIWNIGHCSNIMYPNSTEQVFNKFVDGNPNIVDYLENNDDWLSINEFYYNYLNNKISRDYSIIAINTDKLWNNLDRFATLLKIPLSLMRSFPKKPNINIPNIESTLFNDLNQYISELPAIQVLNQTLLRGEFTSKLSKKNNLKFKLKSTIPFKDSLKVDLFINDLNIDEIEYKYTYKIISEELLQIIITKNELIDISTESEKPELKINYSISLL